MNEEPSSQNEKTTVLPQGIIGRLDKTFGVAAGIVLFVLMAVVTVDVIGRYLFSAPLQGGFEYIQICMALLVFLALPVVVGRQDNVEVEVFQVLIPKPVRRLSRMLGFVVSIIAAMGFAYVSYLRASSFHASGERFMLLPAQLYPIAYFIFAMWMVCIVIMLVQLFGFWNFIKSEEADK